MPKRRRLGPCLFVLLLSIFLNVSGLAGQNGWVTGTVTDASSGETLPGVNVLVYDLNGQSKDNGSITDLDGVYRIDLPGGSYKLQFSFVGYGALNREIAIKAGQQTTVDITLEVTARELDIVVVSGSLNEKKLEEETVSIDVIGADLISNTNSVTLADAVQKAPGVYFLDNQINIRGGTGFTYGAGSRVMVVVDGQPFLNADRGEAQWSYVPMENAEQVEVIKGASSVLYGSSALNGVVHVRTAWPGSQAKTEISTYAGISDKPAKKYRAWWDTPPFTGGINFVHRSQQGNYDLVVGGHLSDNNSHLDGEFSRRGRISFKTRRRPPGNDRLSYGLNGNVMWSRQGSFLIWDDEDTSGFIPFGTTIDNPSLLDWKFGWYTFDPHLTYFDKKGGSHHFKARYYGNTTEYSDTTSGSSFLTNLDYKYGRAFQRGLKLTAGFSGFYFDVNDDQMGEHSGFLGGFFAQIDRRFAARLSANMGARWELYKRDTLSGIGIPVFKAGLNYRTGQRTHVRTSFGMGYRAPSLVELHSETAVGLLKIYANPELDPEYGWNAEIGLKRNLSASEWKGYFDAALYLTEYYDMTEFVFGEHDPNGPPGFKSLNLSRARLAGLEITLVGSGEVGNIPLTVIGGYNYVYPADLVADADNLNFGTFIGNFFQGFTSKDSVFTSSVLKYRFRHIARIDLESRAGKFSFGTDMSYYSFMENIDDYLTEFDTFLKGIGPFRETHDKGTFVLGLRVAYDISQASKLSVLVRNALNTEYALRVGRFDPPRNFTVQYKLSI